MRRSPLPSTRMTYCWSQVRPSRVDWKVSHCASGLKYASAFSPPYVSWRMLVRWVSPDSAATARLPAVGAGLSAALCAHEETAVAMSATAANRTMFMSGKLQRPALWQALVKLRTRSRLVRGRPRRSGRHEIEQVALRLAPVHHLDGLLQRTVVLQVATLRGRVARGIPDEELLELAVDPTRTALPGGG